MQRPSEMEKDISVAMKSTERLHEQAFARQVERQKPELDQNDLLTSPAPETAAPGHGGLQLQSAEKALESDGESVCQLVKTENGSATATHREERGCEALLPAPARDDDGALRFLPVENLTETFQYVPTVAQCHLRAVCAGWNGILTSTSAKRLLYIQSPAEMRFEKCSSFDCAGTADVSARSCWSNRAVGVVGGLNYGAKMRLELFAGDVRLHLATQGRTEKELLGNLVLKDVDCCFFPFRFADFISLLRDVFNSLAAMCHSLTVKNFTCEIVDNERDGCVPITIRIPFGQMSHGRRLTLADWYNMIEQACPLLDDQQKTLVSTTLKECEQDFLLSFDLKQIRKRQAKDPRKSRRALKLLPFDGSLASIDVNRLTQMVQYLMYCRIMNSKVKLDVDL
ncbi:uncharacterized protein LOC129600617 isoform X2 [Paramacrobiotus metropolitanus]|uniref:uncharacterized protein LOC129600617 isoform X2 n=1 Tax=Paramacrobiotus metropolitanus TaxID=2943436 RepID=UPI002446084F|nr:uncharacterized protein LOC129600617 isoform X2 [Paramacrobiotus metropolitanus]